MLERSRFVVGDAAWEKIAPLLPGTLGGDHLMVVAAALQLSSAPGAARLWV
jgi:hypothetical protein